jgi:hypothetical protein
MRHQECCGWSSNLPKPTELLAYSCFRQKLYPIHQRYSGWCLPHRSYCQISNEIHSWYCECSSMHITARYSLLPLSISGTIYNHSAMPSVRYYNNDSTVRDLTDITQNKALFEFMKKNFNLYCVTESSTMLDNTCLDLMFARNVLAESVSYISYFYSEQCWTDLSFIQHLHARRVHVKTCGYVGDIAHLNFLLLIYHEKHKAHLL